MRSQSEYRKVVPWFVALWLLSGFVLGTAVLNGPVRWINDHSETAGWSQSREDIAVRGAIVVYVAATAMVSWMMALIVARTKRRDVRFGIPGLLMASTAAALWLWFTPAAMSGETVDEQVGNQFTFGAYPEVDKLQQLEAEGYTAIVSLLHPAVVPFEPVLLEKEKKAIAETGLELIHLPMLPWIGENEDSLAKARELAETGTGKYYVHCYLGKDRVQLIRRIVEQSSAAVDIQLETDERTIVGMKFERGDVIELDEHLFVMGYPTDEEFLGYILAGTIRQVVSLLDPEDPDLQPLLDKERELLEQRAIGFASMPLSNDDYDPERVLEIAREVIDMPRPLVVHHFLAPSTGKAPLAEAFVQAYRTSLPPIPPTRFIEPMYHGQGEVVAPNVAVGPRPSYGEFGSRLARAGIRRVLYVGPESEHSAADAKASREANIQWRAVDDGEDWRGLLAEGGPWYVYGPDLGAAAELIAERYGPPVPEEIVRRPERVLDEEPPVATAEPLPAGATITEDDDPRAFFTKLIPSPRTIVLLAPAMLIAVAFAAAFAGWLRESVQVRTPYTRKIFHFMIFTTAGLLHLIGGLSVVALFAGIVSLVVFYALWRGDGFPFYEAMARPTDAPRRTAFILVPWATTAMGGLLTNLLFPPFAFVGYLVGGWGDAVGEPVGTAWGKHRYKVPTLFGVAATRSLEGSTAVFLVGAAAAYLGLSLAGMPATTALGVALVCGAAGAVVEAFSHHGMDNLTIQVAAAGVAFLLLG